MVAMAKVRRLGGKLNILGARFYDGFPKFSRALLFFRARAFGPSPGPSSRRWRQEKPAGILTPVECALLSSYRGSFLQRRTKQILATSLFAILWIATVGFGLGALFHYENTPGRIGVLPRAWPESQIERSSDRPTLIMLAHPHCPCTRASVGELAQIMARLQGKITAHVLLVKPKEAGRDWEDTDLRRSVEAIPGVKVLLDPDGVEARRFGAETSGHTQLFATDGRLLFSGGITASRGHAGGNAGESAIIALVNNQTPAQTETLVFGCALANRSETGLTTLCLK